MISFFLNPSSSSSCLSKSNKALALLRRFLIREKQNLIYVVQNCLFHLSCGIARQQGDSSRPTTYNSRYVLLKHTKKLRTFHVTPSQPIPVRWKSACKNLHFLSLTEKVFIFLGSHSQFRLSRILIRFLVLSYKLDKDCKR